MGSNQAPPAEGLEVLRALDKSYPLVLSPNAGATWLFAWRVSTSAALFSLDFGDKELDGLDIALAVAAPLDELNARILAVRAAFDVPSGTPIPDTLPVDAFTAPTLVEWRSPTLYQPDGATEIVVYRAFRPRVPVGFAIEAFGAVVADRLRARFDSVSVSMVPAPAGFSFASSAAHVAPDKPSAIGDFALDLADQIKGFGVGLTVAGGIALAAITAPLWMPAAKKALSA